MKIDIKHCKTNEVLFSHDCEKNNIRITLQKAVEENADLSGANLIGQLLFECNLNGARLAGANLNDADLTRSTLEAADLTDAECFQTHFDYTSLNSATLKRADLTEAFLVETDLRYANLTGAIVTDVVAENVMTEMALLPTDFPCGPYDAPNP